MTDPKLFKIDPIRHRDKNENPIDNKKNDTKTGTPEKNKKLKPEKDKKSKPTADLLADAKVLLDCFEKQRNDLLKNEDLKEILTWSEAGLGDRLPFDAQWPLVIWDTLKHLKTNLEKYAKLQDGKQALQRSMLGQTILALVDSFFEQRERQAKPFCTVCSTFELTKRFAEYAANEY